jgi:hypothetical protein
VPVDIVTPTPTQTGPKTIPHISKFGQYLITEHLDDALDLASGKLTLAQIMSTLPISASGELVLGGDTQLEEQMGLPDEIRAVKVGDQIIQQYDPTLVTLPPMQTLVETGHTVL